MRFHWFVKSSERQSKVGRSLRVLGPTWRASPWRRIAQAACFTLFLVLFFFVAWPGGMGDFALSRARKEIIDIELFLALDPLVGISAAIASRAWVWSLWFGGAMLLIGIVLPRMFCGYLCPMGTLVDLFDWAVSNRVKRFRVRRIGWWRPLRYFVLIAVLVAAAGGVMLVGYVAAIPVLTRGFQFMASPLQIGMVRGWGEVPSVHAAQWVSISLFVGVLLLGLLRPRFWCRHVCPSGALFSIGNLLRMNERKVQDHCIECGKCSKVCSFDAINDDFSTIGANCAFCQTCGGVCPVDAIHFTGRFSGVADAAVATSPKPPAEEESGVDHSRRRFLIGAAVSTVGGALAVRGIQMTSGADLPLVLRPPGSSAEADFVRLCTRCDQCLRVCPTGILQPMGIGQGLDRLWTPQANADFAGCDPSCNNCGQACPTGAIAALTLEKKREIRMGLAEVDSATCLACRGQRDCDTSGGTHLICQDACEAAGYSAILVEGESAVTPVVRAETCVGCGLCQAACFRTNVIEKKLLSTAAIRVRPGVDGRTVNAAASTRPSVDVQYSVPSD